MASKKAVNKADKADYSATGLKNWTMVMVDGGAFKRLPQPAGPKDKAEQRFVARLFKRNYFMTTGKVYFRIDGNDILMYAVYSGHCAGGRRNVRRRCVLRYNQPVNQAGEWFDHVLQICRNGVQRDGNGMWERVGTWGAAERVVDKHIKPALRDVFTQLNSVYDFSFRPSDVLQGLYNIARNIVDRELNQLNKQIREERKAAKLAEKNKPIDVQAAMTALRTDIVHKHMKNIQAMCERHKLCVNDYLYTLQDIIDNPQLIAAQAPTLTIID